jgi:hypothetical protein
LEVLHNCKADRCPRVGTAQTGETAGVTDFLAWRHDSDVMLYDRSTNRGERFTRSVAACPHSSTAQTVPVQCKFSTVSEVERRAVSRLTVSRRTVRRAQFAFCDNAVHRQGTKPKIHGLFRHLPDKLVDEPIGHHVSCTRHMTTELLTWVGRSGSLPEGMDVLLTLIRGCLDGFVPSMCWLDSFVCIKQMRSAERSAA